jgi:hypothetical protein
MNNGRQYMRARGDVQRTVSVHCKVTKFCGRDALHLPMVWLRISEREENIDTIILGRMGLKKWQNGMK